MLIRILSILVVFLGLSSCQFTETLVLNEDGTGRMELSVDMSEIMAMSDDVWKDSSMVKTDSIVAFKDLLEAKKDSIAKLPKEEQQRLSAMANYKLQMLSDPETKKFVMAVFIDFKEISEANDLMRGFDFSSDLMPGVSVEAGDKKDSTEEEIIGVHFSYSNGHFKRDAFIRNETAHRQQLDSLQQAESFMSGITYRLKYTFPKRIKSTTQEDATFSLDGKSLELQRSFLEYFKNPDVMDVEVELEN